MHRPGNGFALLEEIFLLVFEAGNSGPASLVLSSFSMVDFGLQVPRGSVGEPAGSGRFGRPSRPGRTAANLLAEILRLDAMLAAISRSEAGRLAGREFHALLFAQLRSVPARHRFPKIGNAGAEQHDQHARPA